jgi:hypothetical protein
MQNSLVDITTVTPGNYTSTSGNKRDRGKGWANRRGWNQTKIGDIPPPRTAYYPRHRECKSVTDTIMTTWVKAKYPLFNKEISLHCTADDNKRKALNLMAALVGKTFPDDIITDLLANSATNADQMPFIDLFRNAGLDNVVLVQDYIEL